MASIKGFQMKNIKLPLGREGYGCTASLYLNGERIGSYEDYADGAGGEASYVSKEAEESMMKVIIEFAKERTNNIMVDFYNNNPEQFKEVCERFRKHYPYIPEEDITVQTMASNSIDYIVNDFLVLHENEKVFKRHEKKGYRAVVVKGEETIAFPNNWSDEEINKWLDEYLKDTAYEIYFSLDDFVK